MVITIPLLLLCFFVLGFWLVSDSKVKFLWKALSISTFCIFCVIFWMTFDTIMGWSAKGNLMPEIVSIRHVVIKESNKFTKGAIHILIEYPPTKFDNLILNVFGYKNEHSEPRIFKLPYSRKLHEQLQSDVIPQLQRGQIVRGKFTGIKGEKGFPDSLKSNKDLGGESQQQEIKFYNLQPSYFQDKAQDNN